VGTWVTGWQEPHDGGARIDIDVSTGLFDSKTTEIVVAGADRPFADADGIRHTWYGRCFLAIVDEDRWIMALRSGTNHIAWGQRDAIHLLTSTDEGRTWGELDRWFDGTSIRGLPFEDGHTHSEPGLFSMPNGDLILQFWRTGYTSGTKQLRSRDAGRTWQLDINRIFVEGVDGAAGDRVIGTEDFFVDPENPSDVYMAFQYFHYEGQAGTLLAKTQDHGRTYGFVSWIGPLADEKDPDGGATFEPAIEYVGDRTIVAVLRDGAGNRRTWQTKSVDMGASFDPLTDISRSVDGGVSNGVWQRARLYKESNPFFQHGNSLDYAGGEGRLWGYGLHSNGGGYTRKPAVYWSDDNGESWGGPELLHGPMEPGTDTGYGDMRRRTDDTFVAATYYANQDSTVADVEQYTFGGQRVALQIEREGAADPERRELHDGHNRITLASLGGSRWRLRLMLKGPGTPAIRQARITSTPSGA